MKHTLAVLFITLASLSCPVYAQEFIDPPKPSVTSVVVEEPAHVVIPRDALKPTAAVEKASPTPTVDPAVLVQQASKAAQDGNWPVVVGLVILLLGWAVKKFNFLAQVPKAHLTWLTPVLAVLGVAGTSLVAEMGWQTVLVNSILTLATAAFVAIQKPKETTT